MPESAGGRSKEESDVEPDHIVFVNWEGKEAPCHQINWMDDILNAQAEEGALFYMEEKVTNGRFRGKLAPCEAGGSVRLRADKPVLIARLEAEEERNWSHLVPRAEMCKLPRDIAREEINENWKDVSAAKVKGNCRSV